jgi:LmbE family N-acetylglucosaminyl deacetylase
VSDAEPVDAWAAAIDAHHLPPMEVPAGRVVVVAAHPDDETLGAAGLLHAARGPVDLVVATDGEAAFGPGSPWLAAERRTELDDAWSALGMTGTITRLGLPDSALRADDLADLLEPLLREADTCLAPWLGDPHPDHAAAGEATRAAAPPGAHVFGYPIWVAPWNAPDDTVLPWDSVHQHTLDPAAARAKAEALRCFTSQLAPAPDGGPPILPPAVLAHFATGRELFVREPPRAGAPAARFAALYAADGDPWDTAGSPYEQRKREIVLACLPRPRYRHAAEPGCGTGELTRRLTARCAAVTASDFVPAAVAATRAAAPRATVVQAALPAGLPDGVDLVVASEVLYYLAPDALESTTDRIATVLEPGGDLVLVHWRGRAPEAPHDAAAVHRRLREDPRFAPLVRHTDEHFLLDVVRRA